MEGFNLQYAVIKLESLLEARKKQHGSKKPIATEIVLNGKYCSLEVDFNGKIETYRADDNLYLFPEIRIGNDDDFSACCEDSDVNYVKELRRKKSESGLVETIMLDMELIHNAFLKLGAFGRAMKLIGGHDNVEVTFQGTHKGMFYTSGINDGELYQIRANNDETTPPEIKDGETWKPISELEKELYREYQQVLHSYGINEELEV